VEMNRTIKDANSPALLLREPHCPSLTLGDVPRRLQLRQTPQEPSGSHAVRTHLPALDRTAQRFRLNPFHHTAGL